MTSNGEAMQDTFPSEVVHVGFPVYAIEYSAPTKSLFVAGGGGPGRSGVKNVIMTFQYDPIRAVVKKLFELPTGQEAPNSLSIPTLESRYIACGVNDRCWVLERAPRENLSLFKTAKSDFASDDSYQKLVRISPSATEALTIGNDNQIRIWSFPDLTNKDEFSLYSGEADKHAKDKRPLDADYDFAGNRFLIACASAIHIRDVKTGKIVGMISPKGGHQFGCARYVHHPSGKSMIASIENGPSYPVLTLWDGEKLTRLKKTQLSTRLRITCMAVSESGTLMAYGAADGTVGIVDHNLNTLYYKKELHKFIITTLIISDYGQTQTLFTGSGDGTFRCIPVPKKRGPSVLKLILYLVIFLLLLWAAMFTLGFILDESL